MNTSGINRRQFLSLAGATTAVAVGLSILGPAVAVAAEPQAFPPPALPYADNALEPVISARTVSFHYGKHTAAYYANLNKAVVGTRHEKASLADAVREIHVEQGESPLFNNAAQSWNHTFYWEGLTPGGKAMPGKLRDALTGAFGSLDTFQQALTEAAVTQFASGWAWLVQRGDGRLEIAKTSNAMTPIVHGHRPLLTIDVWEHAYYLDYQNRRAEHVKLVIENCLNWEVVASRLA
ncbi:Manganese/iron superoxide dismutase [Alkalidesulfovibrio alkalitolerans DSM 16529]|jgi:Fe-Mn family superoxide dismutase|uniref:Superoxide dismutase n=1 Tax=Alkalidesulfovibrio alkalitolerans DSM 16529 TaxID=1121439 RepID=S7TFV5_9BACT|nr:superoxide dismutase [Alkalidesulfovibrio alkalitolerans]EPR36107.1 Manganese/iron superoxide dismutase [Alkalidesulfovibrio alkalitolerans DSM 16529]